MQYHYCFFFFFYSHITPHSPSGMAGEPVWSRNSRTEVPHKAAPVNGVQANRHEHREAGAHHPAMIKGTARSHRPKPHLGKTSTSRLADQRDQPNTTPGQSLNSDSWSEQFVPKDPEPTTLLSLSGINCWQHQNKKPPKASQRQLK